MRYFGGVGLGIPPIYDIRFLRGIHYLVIQQSRLELPDPDDRHVLATAIRAGAEHIVTENLRDFPDEQLERFGIFAVSADDFLSSTFELYPSEALAVLRTMRRDYDNPPFTPGEFIFDLQKKGLPKLASMLKENIDVL